MRGRPGEAPTVIKPVSLMTMASKKEKSIGGRISGRHGGTIVPGATLSSSCEGLAEGLPTGPSAEHASVEASTNNPIVASNKPIIIGIPDTDPSGDDEMEMEEARGTKRKVDRSRALNDSLDVSISPLGKGQQKRKRTSKRGKDLLVLEDSTLVDLPDMSLSQRHSLSLPLLTSTPERIKRAGMEEKSTEEVSRIALEWLGEIDLIRVKSGSLQGILSGQMKSRILGLEEIIRLLQSRCMATRDAMFLEARNNELEAKLRAGKAAENRLKKDVKSAEDEIRKLRNEAKELRTIMGSVSPSRETGGEAGKGQTTRAAREPPQPSLQLQEEATRLMEAIEVCDKQTYARLPYRPSGRG